VVTAEQIAQALGGRKSGGGWVAKCPAHDDRRPSLSLSDSGDKVLWRCHAGCTQEAVQGALEQRGLLNGKSAADVAPNPSRRRVPKGELVSPIPAGVKVPLPAHKKLGKPNQTFIYRDQDGQALSVVARFDTDDGKQILPLTMWRVDGEFCWRWKALPAPRPLYGLDQLPDIGPLLIVEGEKCVDAARKLGYCAVTSPNGSAAAKQADWTPLAGRDVVVWGDADDAGAQYAETAGRILAGLQCRVSYVHPDNKPSGWDAADATEGEAQALIESACSTPWGRSTEINSKLFDPVKSQIGLRTFTEPQAGVEFVVEDLFSNDVGLLIAPGGVGKSTLVQNMSLRIILGGELFGHRVSRSGPVLVISGEDDVRRFRHRLAGLADQSLMPDTEQEKIARALHFEDMSAAGFRLAEFDGQNIITTGAASELVDAYQQVRPALVVFDPLVSFGPGERAVNDAEHSVIQAARYIRKGLNCPVLLIHHTGKQVARDNVIDQYAGRGGSALADGARFVYILECVKGEPSPAELDPEAVTEGRVFRLHRTKCTDAPPWTDPIWLMRSGFEFRRVNVESADPTTEKIRHREALLKFLRRQSVEGIGHSVDSLSKADHGLSRREAETAIHELEELRLVTRVDLPDHLRRGRKTYRLEVT